MATRKKRGAGHKNGGGEKITKNFNRNPSKKKKKGEGEEKERLGFYFFSK